MKSLLNGREYGLEPGLAFFILWIRSPHHVPGEPDSRSFKQEFFS
jgi:hypothetical protein